MSNQDLASELQNKGMSMAQAETIAKALADIKEASLTKDNLLALLRGELLGNLYELGTQLRGEISEMRSNVSKLGGSIDFQGRIMIATVTPSAIAIILWVIKHW